MALVTAKNQTLWRNLKSSLVHVLTSDKKTGKGETLTQFFVVHFQCV